MRTLVIGDVHGCLRELELLLEKAAFKQGIDRLIFVGDLINKGPSSLAVLQKARELGAECVLGNHELALLIEVEHGAKPRYPRELMSWIRTWPSFIETDDFIVVHGGLVPGVEPILSDPRDLVRIRTWNREEKRHGTVEDPPWFDFYKNKKLVIFGHWAAKGLVMRDNVIGLDSGCVYGKKLSCLIMPGRELVQVEALKVYEKIKVSK